MKRILFVIVFIMTIISLNACSSTHACVSVEEQQEINKNQTHVISESEVTT